MPNKYLAALAAVATLALSACSSDDNNDDQPMIDPMAGETIVQAFSAGRDLGFTAGKIERVSITDGDVKNGEYQATGSDISIATDGTAVYQIGRFLLDNITRYDALDTNNLTYQRSVAGDDASANPYQIVFVNSTKAYVLRLGSDKIWIIDPSATTDEAFKTGELDLSAYNDSDGVPEATVAALVGDRLFVVLSRLENFAVTQPGYVAVFDTTTDTEIDTGQGSADSLKGIPLSVTNPDSLQYLAADDQLYLIGQGNFFATDATTGDRYTGGIESIDATTYETNLVLDDGTEENNIGFLTELLILDATRAYTVTYESFGVTSLRAVNLLTGDVETDVIAGLEAADITTLAEGPQGRVWVGINELPSPGFQLLDPANDAQPLKKVTTEFIPQAVVFVESEVPASTTEVPVEADTEAE